jgi:Domain of unknown function (DUF4279)
MHTYTYMLSLRVKHPDMDPRTITKTLRRKPTRAWKAGERRQTPKGTPLEGLYKESYWYVRLLRGGEASSEGTLLEDYLEHFASKLSRHAEFFQRVRSEEGRAEIFIGMYGARNYGFELPPTLLNAFSTIGLSLTFDIYPYPQTWR